MWKVLLVEDEVFVRESIREIIDWEKFGFKLTGEASNGREALELITADPPDLVLTDIVMPIMDGIELLKEARNAGLACKFVMLTCMSEFEYVRQAMEYGASNYILKLSMSVNDLRDTLQKLSRELQASKELQFSKELQNKELHSNKEMQGSNEQQSNNQAGTELLKPKYNALERPQTSHPEINRILDYIQQHYAQDITVKSMSHYVMMGENYISALFKKKTGKTLIYYLHEVRVHQAIELLLGTGLPVHEIGAKVGFINDNYFIKIFKRHTGQTPSQFRQAFRNTHRTKQQSQTIYHI